MEENTEKNKPDGFDKGLMEVYHNCTAAAYTQCLAETRKICMGTEKGRGNSRSSYYNKMHGSMPLSVAETERLNEMFARYGVTEWQGEE